MGVVQQETVPIHDLAAKPGVESMTALLAALQASDVHLLVPDYDFREIAPFLEKFWQGNEFIMGSRFKGHIAEGAMPALHRYFGTPVTTWILNSLYSSKFSDIHCGMRGITRDALVRMDIQSHSWEYASEMVLKSVQMELRTAEVPVRFLKDQDGRVSHHKRAGWLSPWLAGWINLRSMLVHGAEFFAL